MIFQILLSIFLGMMSGAITGVLPGIHINLVSAVLAGIPLSFASIYAGIFIVSMAVTHTFVDPVPSIYLGAPDEETALAVLPGHELLLKGMGHEAVRLTVAGSSLSLLAGALLFPLFVLVFPLVYGSVRDYIGWILIGVVCLMLWKEENLNRIFWSIVVFLSSGILGMVVLSSGINQPLLPLLSGLFGVSGLIHSAFNDVVLPPQKINGRIVPASAKTAKAVAAGLASGSITALLPGLGASHAAVIASTLFGKIDSITYLMLIGGINIANFLLSLATVYALGKARNGAVACMLQILGSISVFDTAVFVGAALVAGGIAAIIALRISRVFCYFVGRINYRVMCIAVICFVFGIVLVFSGILGIVVLVASAAIGLMPILAGTSRSSSMGCLLLPVIIYFIA